MSKRLEEPNVAAEQRKSSDRRHREDRRKEAAPVAVERRKLERREKVNRRRQIDPTTCERDYSDDEVEFMNAMDAYKRKNGRMFPTCSEILEVLRAIGYVKVAPQPAIPEMTNPTAEIAAPIPAAASVPEMLTAV